MEKKERKNENTPEYKRNLARFLTPGPTQCRTSRGEGGSHPFRRNRSHLEEADDMGTPPSVTKTRPKYITRRLKKLKN